VPGKRAIYLPPKAHGWYRWDENAVYIRLSDDLATVVKTIGHELCHLAAARRDQLSDADSAGNHVDEQTAPGEARLVLDGEGRSGKAVGSDVDQLKEGLQTAKSAERVGGVELRAGGIDFESVGFVFAEFLDLFAGAVGMDDESRFGQIVRRFAKQQSSLTMELRQEALTGAVETRLRVAYEGHGEIRIDSKCTASGRDTGGLGH